MKKLIRCKAAVDGYNNSPRNSMKKAVMTEETARAAGRYIAEHCDGRPVRLAWFGGEPLVNARAIDVVTDCLRQSGVEFYAWMITNGYLFNEAMTRRAKDVWKLEEVQITLDGTEEVYNRRKAFVRPEGSPYQRVLRNIGLLLDAGVPVIVRLNMDGENERDLYALTDELTERFAGRKGFSAYLKVLFENKGVNPSFYTEEERRALVEKAKNLWRYLYGKGISTMRPRGLGLAINSCQADDDSAATITPEGRLGLCDYYEAGIWGSVFTDEKDEEMLQQWKEQRAPAKECKACVVYPRCIRLKKCSNHSDSCSPVERMEREVLLCRRVLAAYEDWKAAASGVEKIGKQRAGNNNRETKSGKQ